MSVMYSFLSFSSFMNNKVVSWIIAIIGLKYCNNIFAVICKQFISVSKPIY